LELLLTKQCLSFFTAFYATVLILGLIGFGNGIAVLTISLLGTTFFHGVARGFGGHVNHQELIVLHSLFFLYFARSFDRLSLNNALGKSCKTQSDPHYNSARLMLRALTFWILYTYFIIGIARLQTSDWRLYQTNAMTMYALEHSLKWNYWNFSFARNILNQPFLNFLLTASFPFATLLELSAPIGLFFRKLTLPVVVSLVIFHIGILLMMNIFFWQNLFLLVIPVSGWYSDRRSILQLPKSNQITIFFDAECGLCDGFIRRMASADHGDLLRFAPLNGETAKKHGIALPPSKSKWTIVVLAEDRRLVKSDAIISIMQRTSDWEDVAILASIVPRWIRDIMYDLVARNRHNIFPKPNHCSLVDGQRQKLLP
jgi:predicted DCC family thiol-disulfide oxidoreductase YuxK